MAKAHTSSNKNIFIDRFFLSYADEEKWLNDMAESGLYLTKKSFYRYYFKKEQGLDIKYTVELLEHPANNPLLETYIDEKRKKGIDLAAFYKCKAYFSMSKENYEKEKHLSKKTRVKSVAYMFASYFIAFIASVLMLCYHCVSSLNFTVEMSGETMKAVSDEFSFFGIFVKLSSLLNLDKILGNYQSTPVALMFFIMAVILSVPTAIYLRELFLSKSKRNSKIK